MKYSGGNLNEARKRWWCVVDARRCFLVNLASKIRDFHDLQTHWNCMRNLTGTLERISTTRSNGIVGSESPGETEEEDSDGEFRVPVEEFKYCLLVEVVLTALFFVICFALSFLTLTFFFLTNIFSFSLVTLLYFTLFTLPNKKIFYSFCPLFVL